MMMLKKSLCNTSLGGWQKVGVEKRCVRADNRDKGGLRVINGVGGWIGSDEDHICPISLRPRTLMEDQ